MSLAASQAGLAAMPARSASDDAATPRRSSRGKSSGRGGSSRGKGPKGRKGSAKKRRRIPRGALVPLIGSLLFHTVLFAAMFVTRPDPLRTRQLTDIEGFESMLAIPPPPMPDPEPVHEIAALPETAPAPAAESSPMDEFAQAASANAVSPTFFNPVTAAPRQAVPSSTPVSRLPVKPKAEAPKPAPVPRGAGFGQVQAQRATKVVYAVDISGAMVPVLPFLLQELRRSVERLDESQSFQVVFFRAEDEQSEPPPSLGAKLLRADRTNKRKLDRVADNVFPGGRSDPLLGLSAALQLKPDVIFLLSRNIRRTGTETQSADDVLAHLDALNPKDRRGQRPVVIKTVQFIDDDPTGLLQAIANNHGDGDGSYRVMSIAELKKQK